MNALRMEPSGATRSAKQNKKSPKHGASARTASGEKSVAKRGAAKIALIIKPHSKGSRSTASKSGRTSATGRATARGTLFLIDLAALRSRSRRRRLVIASLVLLAGAFFAAALVQAQLVQTQAEADRLQVEINRLENDLALLDRQVVEASSPEVIVEQARRLGMVRAVRPVYLVATRPVGP
ncbi:MAG: septum formation initiator family protein [Acidimicrobiia bacterium]|nr:septum formation initiator family protein [Acidimicrobiia bacterium]